MTNAAQVVDLQAGRDQADVELVGETMSVVCLSVETEPAIASDLVDGGGPQPAVVGPVDLRIEAVSPVGWHQVTMPSTVPMTIAAFAARAASLYSTA